MQTPSPSLPAPSFWDTFVSAARFWEPRRLLYNLVLTLGVILWIVLTWPHFRHALAWDSLLFLVIAGSLANLCYSAAYLIDLPLQHASLRAIPRLRWLVFILGTLFALLLETYWIADEVYPFV